MVLLPVLSAAPACAVRDPVCNKMNKGVPNGFSPLDTPYLFLTRVYAYLLCTARWLIAVSNASMDARMISASTSCTPVPGCRLFVADADVCDRAGAGALLKSMLFIGHKVVLQADIASSARC